MDSNIKPKPATRCVFTTEKYLSDFKEYSSLINNNLHNFTGCELIISNSKVVFEEPLSEIVLEKVFEIEDNQSSPFITESFVELSHYHKNFGGVVFTRKNITPASPQNLDKTYTEITGEIPVELSENNTVQLHRIFEAGNYSVLRVILTYKVTSTDAKIFVQELEKIRSEILLNMANNDWNELFEQASSRHVRMDINEEEITDEDMGSAVCLLSGYDYEFINAMLELNKFYETERFEKNIKTLLKNPRQIEKKNIIECYPWREMILSVKADGIHCLLLLGETTAEIMTEKYLKSFEIPKDECFDEYIFEAEIVGNKIFCYDLHMKSGQRIYKHQYEKRLQMLQKVIEQIKNIRPGDYEIKMKPFVEIPNDCTKEQLKNYFEDAENGKIECAGAEMPVHRDGIIINSNQDYFAEKIFKWKPASHLTIDFYVEKLQDGKYTEGKSMKIPYILYSYIDYEAFIRHRFQHLLRPSLKTDRNEMLIPFEPAICPKCFVFWRDEKLDESHPIHGKVCEFKYDVVTNEWLLFRIREDKDPQKGQFGNYFSIADETFFNIVNFIDLSSLYDISFMNQLYFERKRPAEYDEMTKHMNLVKKNVIMALLHRDSSIIDLGCGQGEDIHKYAIAGVRNAIMVDKDLDAIQELVTRKNNTRVQEDKRNTHGKEYKPPHYPAIEAFNLDLSAPEDTKAFIERLKGQYVDAVICNFAIHYFLDNMSHVAEIMGHVKKGGMVIICFMDGQKVFDSLKHTDELDIVEGEKTKYTITKQYQSHNLEMVGQQISIKLPFADEPYTELLTNPQFLKEKLYQQGLKVIAEFNFDMKGDYKIFKSTAEEIHSSLRELSEADKQYVGMYKCCVFVK